MADETQVIDPFVNVPYVEMESLEVARTIEATSGSVAGATVSTDEISSGNKSPASSERIGMNNEPGKEVFYVGNLNAALVLLGNLIRKSGVSEYGIWIGSTSGPYLKYTPGSGLLLRGSDILCKNGDGFDVFKVVASGVDQGDVVIGDESSGQYVKWDDSLAKMIIRGALEAGEVHIPDKDTTEDSFHVEANGDMYIGCTHTQWLSNRNNAKAYVLANGSALFQNVIINGVFRTAVFQKDVLSAVGGDLVVSNSNSLDEDMTADDDSTLTIKSGATLSVDDLVEMKNETDHEWLRITDASNAPEYEVERDLEGIYGVDDNPTWKKGTAVVVKGYSDGVSDYGGGWLELIGSGVNAPRYSIFKRTGVNYDDYTEIGRFGNLNGIAGITSDIMGIYIGDYAAGQYMRYDVDSGEMIINESNIALNDKFGDGSDGDVVISVDTSLTSDMFYDDLTIDSGKTLSCHGYRIFVKGTLTNNGTISARGNDGGNGGDGGDGSNPGTPVGGPGGAAGAAGAAIPNGSIVGAVAGAAGGAGATGIITTVNGTAGSNGGNGNNVTKGMTGSAAAGKVGGAGGDGDSPQVGGVATGGAGGTGGSAGSNTGTIYNKPRTAVAAYLLYDTIDSTYFKTAPSSGASGGGGSGGGQRGTNGRLAGGGGGGGGGSATAGAICVIFAKKIVNNGIITADGGDGGDGGNGGAAYVNVYLGSQYSAAVGGAGGGGGGNAGNGGVIILVYSTLVDTGDITADGGVGGDAGGGGLGLTNDSNATVTNGADGTAGADGTDGIIIKLKA